MEMRQCTEAKETGTVHTAHLEKKVVLEPLSPIWSPGFQTFNFPHLLPSGVPDHTPKRKQNPFNSVVNSIRKKILI